MARFNPLPKARKISSTPLFISCPPSTDFGHYLQQGLHRLQSVKEAADRLG
jgi:hypothetical protein